MNRSAWLSPTSLKVFLLIVVSGILLALPVHLPAKMGAVDFRPYWSSSLLLARGLDFSDPSLLDHVERQLTGWNEPFTMYAWFAPTGNLVLLPFTFFPFDRAAYYWLLTSIAIVFVSALSIWRSATPHRWIPLFAAFGFSMTLLSLIFGQVNTVVVLGVALFLSESRPGYGAGAGLALTTIKPHLVILTLPLLLLDMMRRKQGRALAGFAGVLVGAAIALFALYPAWPLSTWRLVNLDMGTARETATLSGLFVVAGELMWGKWIWVVGLSAAVVVWWKRGREWDRRGLIDVSILAGMMIAPTGWSYDQVMLLLPGLRVLEWASDGSLARRDAIAVALVLIVTNAVTFYERLLTPSEVWYFWVPLTIGAAYVYAWWRKQDNLLGLAGKGPRSSPAR